MRRKGNIQKLQCRLNAAGVSGFSLPSQGTIYGHYGGLFLAAVMDSAQLLSIMEKDGLTAIRNDLFVLQYITWKSSCSAQQKVMQTVILDSFFPPTFKHISRNKFIFSFVLFFTCVIFPHEIAFFYFNVNLPNCKLHSALHTAHLFS